MSDQAARWRRVEELCQAALERSDGGRAVFLQESCGDDEELRLEVEALLAREPSAHRFLNASVGDIAVRVISAPGRVLTGQRVNGLDVGPLLGAGGMDI